MSGLGVAMFLVAIVAIVVTRLPVYAVLLGTGAAFGALGVAIGAFPASILRALPDRIVGLLEHDLLQALPLYAFIGALLNRLPLATRLHLAGERLLARSGAASSMSALGVGALLAPMNGSVGASLSMLSRRIAPALAARGVGRAEPKLDAQVFAVHGDKFGPVQGATMSGGDGLAVRYWNLTSETYYLMAFATDAEGTMHWIYPRYTDPASDPSSVAIAPSVDGRLLDEVVEPESPAEGPLLVTVLISERPLSVKSLERRSGAGRLGDTSDLGAVVTRTWSSTWRAK